jgi:ATP-dependent Clp protease adaptor protein ClpS
MSDGGDKRGSDDDGRKGNGETPNSGVVVKARPKTRKPAMYKVLMLNDDYTPMEFVVHVLERFFQKTREEATRIMLHVHRRGVGVCGVFTYEVAETKVTQVMTSPARTSTPCSAPSRRTEPVGNRPVQRLGHPRRLRISTHRRAPRSFNPRPPSVSPPHAAWLGAVFIPVPPRHVTAVEHAAPAPLRPAPKKRWCDHPGIANDGASATPQARRSPGRIHRDAVPFPPAGPFPAPRLT